ncbi:MAG: hypothetical protein CMJ81_15100 [Planctomycetaceae bacterium]|nr:hypothetical protein [Planctomycetaceae bacterium]
MWFAEFPKPPEPNSEISPSPDQRFLQVGRVSLVLNLDCTCSQTCNSTLRFYSVHTGLLACWQCNAFADQEFSNLVCPESWL